MMLQRILYKNGMYDHKSYYPSVRKLNKKFELQMKSLKLVDMRCIPHHNSIAECS